MQIIADNEDYVTSHYWLYLKRKISRSFLKHESIIIFSFYRRKLFITKILCLDRNIEIYEKKQKKSISSIFLEYVFLHIDHRKFVRN